MHYLPHLIAELLHIDLDYETLRLLGLLWAAVYVLGIPYVAYKVITVPLRRQERERMFLDVLESCLRQGKNIEHALVSLAEAQAPPKRERVASVLFGTPLRRLRAAEEARRNRRRSGGRFSGSRTISAAARPSTRRFAASAASCRRGSPAWLRVGGELGDLARVLPACRATLGDALSRVRGAMNYLVVMASGFFLTGVVLFHVILIAVLPRFAEMASDMRLVPAGATPAWPGEPGWLADPKSAAVLGGTFAGLGALLVAAAILYVWGPRLLAILGLDERGNWLALLLPWRRKQVQRDFSAMLALLLDANVPETRAVELAAESTANRVYARRAGQVVEAIQRGEPLTAALARLDDSGELKWRLANAVHAKTGFLAALAGWHEWLEAKAFQQEQAAAQVITLILVLANGAVVALFAAGMFQILLLGIKAASVW